MIRLSLLGSIELLHEDGRSAHSVLVQPRRTALLATLALTGPDCFRTREELLLLFWPEKDAKHARNALRQTLHFLRKSLGENVIESRGDHEVRLNPRFIWCDVRAFSEALDGGDHAGAVGLYGGDLLEGLPAAGGPEFEQWLDGERGRLRRMFCEAAWRRVTELESAGESGAALKLARRAVANAPFDERGVRALMQLLGRIGDRAEAVLTYERFVASLAAELQVGPDPETEALADQLRREHGNHVAAHTDAVAVPAPVRPSPMRQKTATARRRWLAAVTVLAFVVATALFALASRAGGPDPSGPTAVVVVRAFENRTGLDSLDVVSRIAADAVTMGLNARLGDVDAFVTDDPAVVRRSDALWIEGSIGLDGGGVVLDAMVRTAGGNPLRAVGPVQGSIADPTAAFDHLAGMLSVIADDFFHPDRWAAPAPSNDPILTAGPLPTWKAWQAYSRAVAYQHRGEWTRAQALYERAVEIDPGFTSALTSLAVIRGNLGDFRGADSIFRMVRDRLHDLDAHRRLDVEWLEAALNNDRVERHRTQVALLNLTGADASWQLAYELYGLGRPAETLSVLGRMDVERMRRLGVHRHWVLQAMAHHALGDFEAELDAALEGLEAFPDHIELLAMQASALGALGHANRVVGLVEHAFAVPLQGTCCPARVALSGGEQLAFHGDPEAARRVYETAVAWHEDRTAGSTGERARHARLLLRTGHWAEARTAFEGLRNENPASPDPLGALGIIAARTGDPDEAHRTIALLDPARFHGMDRPVALLLQARIHAALGETDRAMRLLRDARASGLGHGRGGHQPEFSALWKDPRFQRWMEPRG